MMKKIALASIFATGTIDARIHVSFDPANGQSSGGKPDRGLSSVTKELMTESVTVGDWGAAEAGDNPFDSCCEMIESHVFGKKRSYKRQLMSGGNKPVWVSVDDHQIQFNELLQMWQMVNGTTVNPVGEAFTHGAESAQACPTDTEWTVRNMDSWFSMKNFVKCQGENEDDNQAFKLSYTVCDLIQETKGKNLGDRMRHTLQRRKNTLCNRAMNHARRVIRQRKCSSVPSGDSMARSMKTIYAVDTVKQWRDLLKNINEERNEHCQERKTFQLLQNAIDRFHDSVTRLFSKQAW